MNENLNSEIKYKHFSKCISYTLKAKIDTKLFFTYQVPSSSMPDKPVAVITNQITLQSHYCTF